MNTAVKNTGNLSFATFWSGESMTALDKACLASFVGAGYDVTVFSFEKVGGLPTGIRLEDAAEIVTKNSINSFIYEGKPNLSHFSDYFRYMLFQKTSYAWIDTDMIALSPISVDTEGDLFAKESPRSICGAIMRISPHHGQLSELIERTEHLMHTDLVWGATGPKLLSRVIGKEAMLRQAHPSNMFFPINHNDFWKPFLPEYKDECIKLCKDAYSLHLWNNIVVSLGVWKDMAPPKDSFLWSLLNEKRLLHLFRDTYPDNVMQNMVQNWLFRKSGGDIGVIKLIRQAVPSLIRTTKPRVKALLQMRR